MKKGMTGFQLKVLGIITMVFDHLSEFFSFAGIPGWFNWIGRITAPIFLFESSEGVYSYTQSKKIHVPPLSRLLDHGDHHNDLK